MRTTPTALALVLIAAALPGCGEEEGTTSPPPGQTAPQAGETPQPPGSGEPPAEGGGAGSDGGRDDGGGGGGKPDGSGGDQTIRPVGPPYACGGEELRALSSTGPVRLDPRVVRRGQSFTVTITEPAADLAVANLTGVSERPISVEAQPSSGRLRATLRMPADAPCGNKLVTVEGDVSAEAYVGVSD
jgi:hypothetical protein